MNGIPLFAIGLAYIIFSLIFPDRWNYIAGFVCSAALWLGSRTIGRRLLTLTASIPDSWLFPAGLGIVLASATIITSFSTARWLLALIWILLAAAALFEIQYLKVHLPWKYVFFAPLVALAFWSSLTPTTFFDALSYHLGLPYQYLENGRMSVLQNQLYSTFPPFEQVLNLLFAGFECLSGIKLFSLILYLGLIHVLTELLPAKEDSALDPKFASWILALFPAPWILIHLVTADLLASIFFCCAIAAVVRYAPMPYYRSLIVPALFLSFAIWTKINCLLYGALVPLLWFVLDSGQTFGEKGKKIVWQVLLVSVFLAPLFIRNFVAVGDPLYPAFKNIFCASRWTHEQQLVLRLDSFSSRDNIPVSILNTPLLLTLRKGSFGAAAEPGLAFLFGILIYVFVRKHFLVNRILLYVIVCYLLWVCVFFSFRQFIPVFFLLSLPSAIAIGAIYRRSQLLFYGCMSVFAVYSALALMPVFRGFFPLIGLRQTQASYLKTYLDYYPAAEKMSVLHSSGKILFLGESRSAYIKQPVIVPSRYDYNPMFEWLSQSKDSTALFARFRQEGVQFIFCNWKEYAHLAGKSGILPMDLLPPRFAASLPAGGIAATGNKMSRLNSHDSEILREFLSRYVVPVWQSSGILYLYEIRSLRRKENSKQFVTSAAADRVERECWFCRRDAGVTNRFSTE